MSLKLLCKASRQYLFAIGASSQIIKQVFYCSSSNCLPWFMSHVDSWVTSSEIWNREWAVLPFVNNKAAIPEVAAGWTIFYYDLILEIIVSRNFKILCSGISIELVSGFGSLYHLYQCVAWWQITNSGVIKPRSLYIKHVKLSYWGTLEILVIVWHSAFRFEWLIISFCVVIAYCLVCYFPCSTSQSYWWR